MQYTSPIPLLRHARANGTDISERDLSRLQKELLVELDLGGGTITVDGQTLTRNDIISTLDALRQPGILTFHQWIYKSPYLLKLLRHQTPTSNDEFFDLSLVYHQDFGAFQNFISPYLTQPFSKALNQAVIKRDFRQAHHLIALGYLITPSHFDAAFGKLKTTLNDLATEIESIEENIKTFHRSKFTWLALDFIKFLNALPDELENCRDEIVQNLVNLTVRIQAKDLDFCLGVYILLKGVKSKGELKTIIAGNHKIFEQATDRSQTRSTAFGCVKAFVVIVVIIFIIRACSGGSDSGISTERNTMDHPLLTRGYFKMKRLRADLEKLTAIQLDEDRRDSLIQVCRQQPLRARADRSPYAPLTRDLRDYGLILRKSVLFQNNSDYDVIVFLQNRDHIYSASVPRHGQLSTRIEDRDIVSFYIGNQWDDNLWFSHSEFGADSIRLAGLYAKVDSTTLLYATKAWEFRCPSKQCYPMTVVFTSPVRESFRFDHKGGTFKQLNEEETVGIEFSEPLPELSDTSSLKVLDE